MDDEFKDAVVLITGGSSGIGRCVAELFARKGARVAVCGHEQEGVDATVRAIEAIGGEAHGVAANVSSEAAMHDLCERVAARWGGIDALVTAAGIQRYGTAAGTTAADWDLVIDVNLKGAFLATKHALPHLRARRGAIVIVSSVQAFASQTSVSAYAVSKAGLNALARSIALDEAQHGVRANAVCPGSVDTPMLRASARRFSDGSSSGERDTLDSWGKMHPLGRLADPAEIAEVVAFLAGPRSSFVTGVCLPADGGLLASLPVTLP